ncbi:MAG: PEP-utilizing enzyme [Rhodopseudomonas palustris]|nr:PEP-utilizing enzyme [Rhodopseudomonas palustris]
MNGAHAIVTVYPGRTSHAAITAMSMNKPCIVGCARRRDRLARTAP